MMLAEAVESDENPSEISLDVRFTKQLLEITKQLLNSSCALFLCFTDKRFYEAFLTPQKYETKHLIKIFLRFFCSRLKFRQKSLRF